MPLEVRAGRVSIDPRDPRFYSDPYPAYAALREAGPLVHWDELGYPCLTRHADVNAALRDRRLGRQILHVATREELGWAPPSPTLAPFLAFEEHSLLELEPPRHTRLRSFVNTAFLPRRVDHLRPRIAALAHALLDELPRDGEFDLLERYATPIPVLVIADFLGVPREQAPQLLAWSHDMVAIYQVRRGPDVERRTVAATQEFRAYMRTLIAHKRREPADDFLSHLVDARDAQGERMSEDELVTTAILLLNAGHEATVHAIGNGVLALLRASRDPAREFLARPAEHCEEMLRFDAPLHLFTRFALCDMELAGRRFAKGERVGLLLASANRDPERFAEPERFDPTRSPNSHLSFGAGIHVCVGAPLARLELQVALEVLFERLPRLALAAEPHWRDTWHFHGLEALHLRD